MLPLGQGIPQHLHRVAHRILGAELLQMQPKLGETTDVSGGDEIGPGRHHRARFLFAQRRRDRGLIEIVTAGAAATELTAGDLPQFDAGNRAQQIPRLAAHALRMGQVTGVVVGDRPILEGLL